MSARTARSRVFAESSPSRPLLWERRQTGSGSNGAENARSRPRKQASGKESTVSAKRCIEVVLVVGNYTQLNVPDWHRWTRARFRTRSVSSYRPTSRGSRRPRPLGEQHSGISRASSRLHATKGRWGVATQCSGFSLAGRCCAVRKLTRNAPNLLRGLGRRLPGCGSSGCSICTLRSPAATTRCSFPGVPRLWDTCSRSSTLWRRRIAARVTSR